MSLTQILGNSVTQTDYVKMIFHVRFMLFEVQPIKHNTAFDYKTKTIHYIIIEISITNNSDCKLTLCMSPAWPHEGILCMRLRGFYICQLLIIWDSPSET